jgi:hypothetical protein
VRDDHLGMLRHLADLVDLQQAQSRVLGPGFVILSWAGKELVLWQC